LPNISSVLIICRHVCRNRAQPKINPTILLRESYREEGKVKKRTLANLTRLPAEVIKGIRKLVQGATVVEKLEQAFDVVRSFPHGHVALCSAPSRT
jgi:hypothetical protein